MKMVRLSDKAAILLAPGFPIIAVVKKEDGSVVVDWLDKEISVDMSFGKVIQMVEESAQTTLESALILLARRVKGEDIGYGGV